MQKLLIVNNNMNIGGVQKSLLNLLKCISSDYDVTLLLFHRSGALLREIPSNVKVITSGAPYAYLGMSNAETDGHFSQKLGRGFFAGCAKLLGAGVSMALMRPFHRMLKGYDVAISFLHSGAPKSFYGGCNEFVLHHVQAKRKVTFLHCDFAKIGANTPRNRRIYAKFDAIAACSEGCKRAFLAAFPEFAEKTLAVENCQDFDAIRRKASEPFPFANKEGLQIVTVARLGREKGIDRALEAIAALPDAQLHYTVIGDGVERTRLEAKISELELSERVTLAGESENPYGAIRAADLLLIPSYSEAAPMVIAESASLGTPVLSTLTSSAEEMVAQSGYGWVCENSIEGIRAGLSALLDDLQKLREKQAFLQNLSFDNEIALTHFRALIKEGEDSCRY